MQLASPRDDKQTHTFLSLGGTVCANGGWKRRHRAGSADPGRGTDSAASPCTTGGSSPSISSHGLANLEAIEIVLDGRATWNFSSAHCRTLSGTDRQFFRRCIGWRKGSLTVLLRTAPHQS